MNHILICLLALLFSLSGPAIGKYSDFLQSSNAANGGPVPRAYAWGADLSGGEDAGGIGGLAFIRFPTEGKTLAVGGDAQGNTSALYDMENAALVGSYEYGPSGEPLRASGPFAAVNPFRFSTKYESPETGWLGYTFRDYIPVLGRWASQDPIGEAGGINLYGFVGNNPANAVDPHGLFLEAAPTFAQLAKSSIATAAGTAAGLGAFASGGMALLPVGIVILNDTPVAADPSITYSQWWGDALYFAASGIHGMIFPENSALKPASMAEYWKQRAANHGAGEFSEEDLSRMRAGLPPVERNQNGVCAPTVEAPRATPPFRQQYIDEVVGLKDLGLSARAAGADAESVARMLHAERRALGVQYKDLTPADELARITQRNIKDYGDPLGPSIDWLRARGKTWDDIIESASRPGGKDLGY